MNTTTVLIGTRAMETARKQIEGVAESQRRHWEWHLDRFIETLTVEVAIEEPDVTASLIATVSASDSPWHSNAYEDFRSSARGALYPSGRSAVGVVTPTVDWATGGVTFTDDSAVLDLEPLVAVFAQYGYRAADIRERTIDAVFNAPHWGCCECVTCRARRDAERDAANVAA